MNLPPPHQRTPTELRVALAEERQISKAAVADLSAEVKAHAKTRRDFRLACIVLVVNTLLLIVLAVKYLRIVDLPKPRCLHPVSFTASHLELAPVTEAPRETI